MRAPVEINESLVDTTGPAPRCKLCRELVFCCSCNPAAYRAGAERARISVSNGCRQTPQGGGASRKGAAAEAGPAEPAVGVTAAMLSSSASNTKFSGKGKAPADSSTRRRRQYESEGSAVAGSAGTVVRPTSKQAAPSSQFDGVTWDSNCQLWRACIELRGKVVHLGVFTTERGAAAAHDRELKKQREKAALLAARKAQKAPISKASGKVHAGNAAQRIAATTPRMAQRTGEAHKAAAALSSSGTIPARREPVAGTPVPATTACASSAANEIDAKNKLIPCKDELFQEINLSEKAGGELPSGAATGADATHPESQNTPESIHPVLQANQDVLHQVPDYVPFNEGLQMARSLGYDTRQEWQKWWMLVGRPYNLPENPHQTYKHKGWQGYRHWLVGSSASSSSSSTRPRRHVTLNLLGLTWLFALCFVWG